MMTDLNEPDHPPTAFPEINVLLRQLAKELRLVLGSHLVGLYVEGSLANGDFDQDSDIDFVVVTDQEVSDEAFGALHILHERLNALNTRWSCKLEGTYLSGQALRRHDAKHADYFEIEWGVGARLKKVTHDEAWDIHRHILREHGLTVMGPAPYTLIDPVSPKDLRQAMLSVLNGWATHVLEHPSELTHHEYQSYTVLSVCRILYTLEAGAIVSKATAARWVQTSAGDRWGALIDRALTGRHNPQSRARPEDTAQTQDFIRYALARGEEATRKWRL